MACREGAPGLIWQRQGVKPQASRIVWYDHREPSVVYFLLEPPISCCRTERDGFFSVDDLTRTLLGVEEVAEHVALHTEHRTWSAA